MTVHTSIVIVPPQAVQAVAVPLLRQYTYDFPRRLPAHLTVAYPFVPPADLRAATEKLNEMAASIPPFQVTLSGYGAFPLVAYMDVVPCPPLIVLQAMIHRAFPGVVMYEGQLGEDAAFVPHVTVGVFQTKAKQQAAELPPYAPLTFLADRLVVGMGDDEKVLPWVVQDVVHLRG